MSLNEERKKYLDDLFDSSWPDDLVNELNSLHLPQPILDPMDAKEKLNEAVKEKFQRVINHPILSKEEEKYISRKCCEDFMKDDEYKYDVAFIIGYFVTKKNKIHIFKRKHKKRIDIMNIIENMYSMAEIDFKNNAYKCVKHLLSRYFNDEFLRYGIDTNDILKLITKHDFYLDNTYESLSTEVILFGGEPSINFKDFEIIQSSVGDNRKEVKRNKIPLCNELMKWFKIFLEKNDEKIRADLRNEIKDRILFSYLYYNDIFKYCKYYEKFDYNELSPLIKWIEEQYHPLTLLHIHLRKNYKKLYDKNLIFVIKSYLMLD